MTKADHTDFSLRIWQHATAKLPVAFRGALSHDPQATTDKPGRKALKFCTWGTPKRGFWDRDYASYHIVFDPYKELSQAAPFQVRFMFFLKRKPTSSGRFNQAVAGILNPLDGQHGFKIGQNHKTIQIFRLYHTPVATPALESEMAEDLGWLLNATFVSLQNLGDAAA